MAISLEQFFFSSFFLHHRWRSSPFWVSMIFFRIENRCSALSTDFLFIDAHRVKADRILWIRATVRWVFGGKLAYAHICIYQRKLRLTSTIEILFAIMQFLLLLLGCVLVGSAFVRSFATWFILIVCGCASVCGFGGTFAANDINIVHNNTNDDDGSDEK